MYAIANDVSFYLPLAETVMPSWQLLDARFQAMAKRRGADEVEEARLLRLGEAERIWVRFGDPTYEAYLERRWGYPPRYARERLRVAHALGELPNIEAALVNCDLFYSAVRELTRVVVPRTESAWLEKARGQSLRQVERMVSGRKSGDLPEAPSRPENIRHVLGYEVSASTFAKVRQAQRALEDEVGHRLDDDEFLNLLAERALAPGESSTSRRAPHQIGITVCECGRAWQDAGGTPVEIDRVSLDVAECDAERIGRFDAKTPERASQDISPATRRRMLQRDENRCQVVGCRASRNLHAHHIQHREDGGTGELDNLVTLCSAHHRAYHRGLLHQVVTEDGELRFEPTAPMATQSTTAVIETVTHALVRLGFSKKEAESFVATAVTHVGRDASVEVLLREALRRSPLPGGR